jgi:chorismate mutase
MYKATDKSLIDAMSWAGVRELPEVYDGENIYIKALALVAKRDGSTSYVAMCKNKSGEDKIVKDFGSSAQIAKILEVRPYLYLDASFVPDFASKKKEERVRYLNIAAPNEGNYEEMTIKELNKAIINVAIQKQIKLQNQHG